jgi:hypothetical protein
LLLFFKRKEGKKIYLHLSAFGGVLNFWGSCTDENQDLYLSGFDGSREKKERKFICILDSPPEVDKFAT